MIGAVAVGMLLAGGGVLGAVAMSGEDDSGGDGAVSGDAGGTADATGADPVSVESARGSEIVRILEDAGYTCDDSLDEPVVRRCFATRSRPSSESQSGSVDIDLTVGLQTNDRDEVERFKVTAESKEYAWPLTEQLTATANDAWRLVAPPLLGEADAMAMADRLGSETARKDSTWGMATFFAAEQTQVSVDVLADGIAPTPYEQRGIDRTLTAFQSSLERRGFRCSGPTLCQCGAYALQLPLDDSQPGLVGFSVDAYPHATPRVTMSTTEAVRVLRQVVTAAGVGGDDVRALITDGFTEGRSTVTADIDGVNYSLSTRVDGGSVDLVRLEVYAIAW